MIPRLSPPFDYSDCTAALRGLFETGGVERFENSFAAWCEREYALSFPYCRSALYAFMRVQGWANKEIIIPAYTCASVPAAVVVSGNRPRFVDIDTDRPTMNMNEAVSSLNRDTRAILLTPMYGYPPESIDSFATLFEKKGVTILHDCALGLGCFPNKKKKPPCHLLLVFSWKTNFHRRRGYGRYR